MFYKLLDEPVSTSMLGPWEHHLDPFVKVIGFSPTGTLFLCNATDDHFAAFYPTKPDANTKAYGPFDGIVAFEEAVLKSPGFEEYSCFPLSPADLPQLSAMAGPLEGEEIYIPAPYGFMGGSLDVSTFEKGNVWISTNIIARFLGISDAPEA